MKTIKLTLVAFSALFVLSCNKQNATDKTEKAAETKEVAAIDGVQKATPVVDDTAAKVADADAPVLTLESDTYDFGDVQASAKNERVIEFTNTGKSPLLIKSAKASCGCTVPEYSKEPVAPGEKGTLKVSYKAPGTNGKQTKTVTLTTNTAKGTERFKITANVIGGQERKKPAAPKSAPAKKLPAPKLESVN